LSLVFAGGKGFFHWHFPFPALRFRARRHLFDRLIAIVIEGENIMLLNGSQIFVEVLCEQGVDTIFGYPGGSVLNLYDELYKNSDRITHVLTAHEQGASHAADGYARATGRTGVVLATSGPGATNLVTGIATAYMDSVPMVAFTGNVPTSGLGRDSFQEAYIEGITMPITKHNFTVRRVEDLADTMRAAFRIAQSGRKGPVLVDIPKDVTANSCEFTSKRPEPIRTVTTYDARQVQWAADIINGAKRPLVYFGGGVRSAASCVPLRELLHKAQIPATYTLMAAGVVPYGDPMNLGLIGMHGCYASNKAVSEADVVIAVGTRFSDRVALKPNKFAEKATIIQIDIDPSEIGKNVDIDLAVVGDAAYILRAMLPLIQETTHPEWMAEIADWQKKDYHPQDDDSRLMPHQIIGEVCEQCGPEAVYVTDVGQHQMWAAQYVRHVKSRGFITSGGLGTMGFGYGAAIGAQMALGRDQRVVHFTGDGSFHMNLNEACTAVSYELPIITVIFNNQVLGMVRQWQTSFYGKRYSQTDPHRKTDYVKLAEGFGLQGYHCENLAEFRAAFAEALTHKGPTWIECVIDKDEKVLPMIPGGGDISNIIME
jgi:acetolactate synthase-1/2/3 large subunit